MTDQKEAGAKATTHAFKKFDEAKMIDAFSEGGRAKGLLEAAKIAFDNGQAELGEQLFKLGEEVHAHSEEIATEAGIRSAV